MRTLFFAALVSFSTPAIACFDRNATILNAEQIVAYAETDRPLRLVIEMNLSQKRFVCGEPTNRIPRCI